MRVLICPKSFTGFNKLEQTDITASQARFLSSAKFINTKVTKLDDVMYNYTKLLYMYTKIMYKLFKS